MSAINIIIDPHLIDIGPVKWSCYGHYSGLLCVFFLLFVLMDSLYSSADEHVIVPTSIGKVRGRVKKISDESRLDMFLGIPYAQPPIGPLRFEKPVPITEDPSRTIDALAMPMESVPHHRQDNFEEYSEDSLYLNLYSPHQTENNPRTLLPTLVLINVGGFQFGSMRHYKNFDEIGRKFVAKGVVMVAIQFRIGFLGFASLGNSQLPGNLAYWDMTLALRWIRQNVANFGGDPERVTLFGYSSAATSIATLGLSPHSRDLFLQAFQMGGPLLTVRAASDRVVWATHKLASELGCTSADPADIKQYMKTKSIEQFFDAMDRLGPTLPDINYVLFGPVFDSDFIPSDFTELIHSAPPKKTVVGLAELEPLAFATFQGNNSLRHLSIPRADLDTFNLDHFKSYLLEKAIRNDQFGGRTEELIDEVAKFYTEGLEVDSEFDKDSPWFFVERLVQFLSDVQFVVPIAREIQLKVEKGWPLYLYISKFVNPKRFPSWLKIHKNFHGTDYKYIVRDEQYEYDAEDEEFERQLGQMLVNFVKIGDPSIDSVEWPQVSGKVPFDFECLNINLPLPSVINTNDFRQRVHFWTDIAQKYPEYEIILGRKGQK